MKHLTKYKLFELKETEEDIVIDIKDCFLSVSDLLPQNDVNYGLRARMTDTNHRKSLGFYVVVIKPYVLPGNYEKKYRPSETSPEIIYEIENSINLSKGTIGLEFTYAMVYWVNGSDGPGATSKSFKKGGSIPGSPLKGAYDIDYLFDFLIEKCDKIREMRLYFDKI